MDTGYRMNLKKTDWNEPALLSVLTKRGIAYAYSDKYRKKSLRHRTNLLHLDDTAVQARLKTILESKKP